MAYEPINLENLEKRVRELETDLPELIAEKVATLKTENAELRDHLNATNYHHYLAEVNELTQEEWNDLLKI